MRIGLVSREYPPETGWGGIGTYAHRLAHALAALGHDVHVISRSERLEEYHRTDGDVSVHRIRERKYQGFLSDQLYALLPIGEWRYGRRVAAKLKALHRQAPFDIVEAPEYRAEAFHAVRRSRIPIVMKLHSPSYLMNAMSNTPLSFRERLVNAMERATARQAVAISCPSVEMAGRVVSAWRLPLHAVACVPNPISPVHEELLWPGPEVPPTILFVGRVDHRKGALVMADAIPKILQDVPEARFILVGAPEDQSVRGGSRDVYRRLVDEWRAAGVLDRITLVPWQKDPLALQAYYRRCHVMIVPSLYENFPNVCLEGMLASRAVVAFAVGGIPEIITSGVDGELAQPGDPEAFHRAVVALLRNPERARLMGRAARESVIRHFDAGVIASQTVRWYEEVLATRARRSTKRVLAIVTERWVNWDRDEGVAMMVPEFLRGLERAGMSTRLIRRAYQPDRLATWGRSGALAVVRDLLLLARDVTEPIRNFGIVLGQWLRRPGGFNVVWEYYSFYGMSGWLLSRLTGAPLVLNVDAPLIEEYERLQGAYLGRVRRAIGRSILRRNLARAAAVHVPSQVLAEWLVRDYGVPRAKLHVIPNGVHLEALARPADRAALRQQHALGAAPVVLFVGSLQPWHGCDVLLEAFAQVVRRQPEARLLIIGDGKVRDALERQAAHLKLNGSAQFVGYVPHTRVAQYLALADIAVLPYPSLPIPFYFSPIKLFEYMGAGKAIVASRLGQIAELLQDRRTARLVSPGSVTELADALAELCASADRGARLGAQARQAAEAHTWTRRGQALAAICQDVLARPGQGGRPTGERPDG